MMVSTGNIYTLRYLGSASLSKFTTGLASLQKPLHEIYVTYLTPRGPKQPSVCRLALNDRGIILTINGNDLFYSMRDILLWEAVQWVYVQTKDKKIMSAFEPIDPDPHRGMEGLFSKLDNQYKYLAKLNHEAVLACVLRRTSGPKTIDVHAFLCSSEDQILDVVASLWQIQKLFKSQEARGIGVFDNRQSQEPAKSVKVMSTKQVKGRRGDGEITLEELMRLADCALADPAVNGVTREAAFQMGESWGSKETRESNQMVRRSKTFNEGSKNRAASVEELRRSQGRFQNQLQLEPQPLLEAGGGPDRSQLQGDQNYYNSANPILGQATTYENLANVPNPNQGPRHPSGQSPVSQPRLLHQQQPIQDLSSDVEDLRKKSRQQVNSKQKNIPLDSLRMVISESRMEAKRRSSVLPGSDFGSALVGEMEDLPHASVLEIYSDHEHAIQPIQSPKPVAMVQPRKVQGVKVLPEPGLDVIHLQKVSQQPGSKGHEESRKEQYLSGNQNYSRSMNELNVFAAKPLTPQVARKSSIIQPDPLKKVSNAEADLGKKISNPEPDPARKISNPEPTNRDGRESKATDKQKPERVKKDAEIEAFAMNINFDRSSAATISPHGTNFESALGYFP